MVLADEGAAVALLDRADAGAVAAEIGRGGGRAQHWILDVSDRQAAEGAVAAVVSAFGRLDILVNNAGISAPVALGDESWPDVWEKTLAVNLSGQAFMARACLPHLQASDAGRVVNIASTEGLGASAGSSAYTVSKHGVVGLTRSLAVELGHTGVTCNCVCPGPIHTGMTEPIPDAAKEKFARRRVPLRRYGNAEEVAHMTVSLCLPAASYCNGAVVVVDGGMLAQNT